MRAVFLSESQHFRAKKRTRLMKPCLHLVSPKCENSTMEKMYF